MNGRGDADDLWSCERRDAILGRTAEGEFAARDDEVVEVEVGRLLLGGRPQELGIRRVSGKPLPDVADFPAGDGADIASGEHDDRGRQGDPRRRPPVLPSACSGA